MGLTKSQAAARRIGGSSAAKVMGASKYSTRYEQWMYDTHQIEREDLSDKVDIIVGNKLEEPLRRVMCARGVRVDIEPELLTHPDYDYWSGYIDGFRDDTVVEFKTSIDWRKNIDFGDDGTDEIPLDYMYQVQHYMLHPRFNHAELHVVFMPAELKQIIADIDFSMDELVAIVERLEIRSYYIEPDVLLMDNMISEYAYYWNCVQTKTEPKLLSYDEVVQAYQQSKPGNAEAPDEDLSAIAEMIDAKAEIKRLNAKIKKLQFGICEELGESDTLICGGKKVATWRTQETKRLDTQAIKDAGLYEDYVKITKSRVFRLSK